jgi:hypothetical protein
VAGAVRTIKDLQQQVAELEAQLARQSITPSASMALTPASSSLDKKTEMGRYKDFVGLTAVMSGLGNSGVVAIVIALEDCTIKDANNTFEIVSGFGKGEVIGKKFCDSPLFGRYVHGQYPRVDWALPTDPHQAVIPTASAEDYSKSDFQQAVAVIMGGGSWKVVSRHMTRDGKVVEALNTLFLLRNLDGQPYAVMCISNNEKRRVVPIPPTMPSAGRALASRASSPPSPCIAPFSAPYNALRSVAQPS